MISAKEVDILYPRSLGYRIARPSYAGVHSDKRSKALDADFCFHSEAHFPTNHLLNSPTSAYPSRYRQVVGDRDVRDRITRRGMSDKYYM